MRVVAPDEQMAGGSVETEREFRAMVDGCGLYRIDRGLISLTGADRVRWLNGMVTNNIRDLAVGQGVYAFVLNPQGKIQADLYAFNRGETLLVSAERAQVETILQIFNRYILMEDVEALLKALLQVGAQEVHEQALETFRIACGIPKFGVDIRQRDLPQETGQDRALNFSKGCYIGQEIVERIRSRGAVHRVFTGFE